MRTRVVRKSKVFGGKNTAYVSWCSKKGGKGKGHSQETAEELVQEPNDNQQFQCEKYENDSIMGTVDHLVEPLFSPMFPYDEDLPEYQMENMDQGQSNAPLRTRVVDKTMVVRWEAADYNEEPCQKRARSDAIQHRGKADFTPENQFVLPAETVMNEGEQNQMLQPYCGISPFQQMDHISPYSFGDLPLTSPYFESIRTVIHDWPPRDNAQPEMIEQEQSTPPVQNGIPLETYKRRVARRCSEARFKERQRIIVVLEELRDKSGDDSAKFGMFVKRYLKRLKWHPPLVHLYDKIPSAPTTTLPTSVPPRTEVPPTAVCQPVPARLEANKGPLESPKQCEVPVRKPRAVLAATPVIQAHVSGIWSKMVKYGIELLKENVPTIALESADYRAFKGNCVCYAHKQYIKQGIKKLTVEPIPDKVREQLGLVPIDKEVILDLDLNEPHFVMLHKSSLRIKADGFVVGCLSQVTRDETNRIPYFKCCVVKETIVKEYPQNIRACSHLSQLAFLITKPPTE